MEVLGGTASIIALLELTAILVKSSTNLWWRLKDAPKDLDGIRRELERITVILREIQNLQNSPSSPAVPQAILDSLQISLRQTSDVIRAFQDDFKDFPLDGWKARIYWASIGHKKIKKREDLLRSTKENLSLHLNLLSFQIDVAIANKQRDVAVQQDIMLAEVVEIKASVTRLEHAQQAGQVPEAQEPTPTASPSRSGSLPSTSTASSSSSWGSWLWFRGIKWGIISAAGANQKTYEVWARFVLPTSGSDASQALIAALVLRVRSPLNFNFGPRTGISVSNLVPEDAAIMLACKNGDLRQVRILLDTGQADAADITMNNRTPLDYAIESGNIDLVECLIRWKRSLVNQPFGTRSTSPLQSAVYERNIEMARLLLHYRADGDHLSAFGWNALFYLWVEEDHASHDGTPKSTIEFLRMFNASNISFDLTIRDSWGWTAVQRAAAEGKAEEVSAILALSEAPMTTARGLGPAVTEAIKTAVDSGDNEIFTALLPAYGDIDRPLDNEWTLLETAAYHGHEQIMLKLLRAGAEEFALDGPCFPDLITEIPAPDDLDDAAWDTERCKLYMKVLVEAGKVIKCVESNEDGVDEELYFWDSSEEPLVES